MRDRISTTLAIRVFSGTLHIVCSSDPVNVPMPRIKKAEPAGPYLDLHVNMSNIIARAAHGLSLGEKRLIAICIAKGDSKATTPLASAAKVRVTAAEYAETFGLDKTTAYEQLVAAGDTKTGLMSRSITYFEKSPTGVLRHAIHWVDKASYSDGAGWIEITWHREIAPHLFCLQGAFSMYKLRQAAAYNSLYSWRLLECLHSWRKTRTYAVSVDEFCDVMDLPDSYRKNFRNIRARVIEPAVKELKEKSGISVSYREIIPGGRKVTGLEFKWEMDKQGRLPLDEDSGIGQYIEDEDGGFLYRPGQLQ